MRPPAPRPPRNARLAAHARPGERPAASRWQARYREAREVERAGDTPAAIAMLEEVVAVASNEHVPHHDLAVLYRRVGRLADALREFHAVATLCPHDSTAANDVAAVLSQMGHQPLAFASVERALALDPTNVAAMHNLAEILKHMGDAAAARDVYAAALALAPNDARARMQYGMVLVALGAWPAGWAEMEHREEAIGVEVLYRERPQTPRWTGREPLSGKRLLIVHEQGLGDSIMCARFAATLAARGATVHLRTMEPLLPLLSAAPGVAECSVDGTPLPDHDLHIPLMSLMHALAIGPEGLDGAPYLAPQGDCPPHLVAQLPRDGVPTVALTWAGNPLHTNDHRRSMRGAQLAPLLQLPGVRFVAMQKSPAVASALPPELQDRLVDLGAQCHSFNDTAHALQRVDLLVTVDTSVAHLAGATGVRTLLCLPFCPDYRWGVSGEHSPWYDSHTMLRQQDASGWDGVLGDVMAAVRQLRDRG